MQDSEMPSEPEDDIYGKMGKGSKHDDDLPVEAEGDDSEEDYEDDFDA